MKPDEGSTEESIWHGYDVEATMQQRGPTTYLCYYWPMLVIVQHASNQGG